MASTSLVPQVAERSSQCISLSSEASFFSGRKLALPNFSAKAQHGHSQRFSLRIEAKGRKSPVPGMLKGRDKMPEMPKIDPTDDTPRFVLFISATSFNRWYPLSVVTGGSTAKLLVNVMKNDWGNKLYGSTLTKNIAAVIYKDEKAVITAALKQYAMLKGAPGYQYGYKIMDPKNPRQAMFGSDVIVIPPESEMKSVLDKAKDFFSDKFGSMSFLSSSDSPAPASPDAKPNKQ